MCDFNETNFYFNKSSEWIKTTDWRWAQSLQEHTNVFPVCAWTPTLTNSCHWPVISTIKHLYIVSNCSAHRLRTPVYNMLNFKTTFPLGRGTWWSGASHVFAQTAFSKTAEKTMFKTVWKQDFCWRQHGQTCFRTLPDACIPCWHWQARHGQLHIQWTWYPRSWPASQHSPVALHHLK